MTKIIGITGPIASGKDEVCKILLQQDAFIIDADEIGHALENPQTPAWSEIVKVFGSQVLKPGGQINRTKLAKIVFSDKTKLIQLNQIIHPYMFEKIVQIITAAKERGEKLIVINAAVLNEIGLLPIIDKLWFIEASQKKRLERTRSKNRDGLQIKKIFKIQGSMKEIKEKSDFIINNNATLNKLKQQVNQAIQTIQ